MTSVNTAKTRSFSGADIGSDHDLVMMSFRLLLKKIKMQGRRALKKGRHETAEGQKSTEQLTRKLRRA